MKLNLKDKSKKKTFHWKRCDLAVIISICLASAFWAQSGYAELYFNPNFLSDDPDAVADLSRFEQGQEVLPGTYRVDIYLNDNFVASRDVQFVNAENDNAVLPCFTSAELMKMGVRLLSVNGKDTSKMAADEQCYALTLLVEGSTADYNVNTQRLDITIPQALMSNRLSGDVSPDLWDEGINAGLLNYSFNGNNTKDRNGFDSNTAYLNLNSGINIGPWRLRDNSVWNYSDAGSPGKKSQWQHINTWLERDIKFLRSRLTLGDTYSDEQLFDSINFRGVKLASDDNMLPESQRGFAPVVRGIARGTAQISIKQNGYEVYQTTVPPGPFAINDIYSLNGNGDLNVTVTEADGSTQNFTVPFSTVPFLQREGHTRYNLIAGEYRSGNSLQTRPKFFQGTLFHGLKMGWTIFGGSQLSSNYRALDIGLAKNMGILGALSFDITQAYSTLVDRSKHQGQSMRLTYNKSFIDTGTSIRSKHQGQSMRLTYNKSFIDTGTSIRFSAYRYSTSGFYNFADTTYSNMAGYIYSDDPADENQIVSAYNLRHNKRGKFQFNITQSLTDSTSFYLSGTHQTYWGTSGTERQLMAGINTMFTDVSVSVNYSLNKNYWMPRTDTLLSANVSVPFSHWMRSDNTSAWRNASARYSMSSDLKGNTSNLVGLYGNMLEDRNLSYSVQTGYVNGNSGGHESSYASLNYRGGYGNANAGYSRNGNYQQLYYGVSGGVVAHANGVTLGQSMSDSVVLVKAPGASNVSVQNQPGVKTDYRGYAIVPYAVAYRENRIALNPNTLPDNVEIDDAIVDVVPTQGAVARAEFTTHTGLKILMTLMHNNKPVPFGAVVSLGNSSGIVTDDGQAYLTGMPASGKVKVQWGNSPNTQCSGNYAITDAAPKDNLFNQLTVECR
ncbi:MULTISPECIES: fimbria/pilus outer membrane usher protein [Enterobacteriaceae]|uniref:Fimbria/pilus outer membrane usher protein n=3 Tax=Escherichia coli TaxID=562 RepID=A0A6G6AKK0_ECOLX|nr:fimbria/pilus outer membrane usher protein [Escherichia coli]EBY4184597.1 fimbrial biogenesis outer membrane usher protein [Salmonella enterica subsp. enterica serovar Saintpaul]ELX9149902.1 fimbrial biogenesis outer membrane usher protein [Salmonella enterica]EFI7022243.1 fimbrial biogenesis outer membrane usher protein [Escherichia coli]EFN7961443.1 fimbrial biogenesis outer membrane usher protein [Escherichia coli]EIQ1992971.1 fimbrial biogenesis outer membrane usher protein [Escherichia